MVRNGMPLFEPLQRPLIFRPPAPRRVAGSEDNDAEGWLAGGVLRWLTEARLEVRIEPGEGVVAVHATRIFGANHVVARYFTPELRAVCVRLEHVPAESGELELVADVLLVPAAASDEPVTLSAGLQPDEGQRLAEELAELLSLPVEVPAELAQVV